MSMDASPWPHKWQADAHNEFIRACGRFVSDVQGDPGFDPKGALDFLEEREEWLVDLLEYGANGRELSPIEALFAANLCTATDGYNYLFWGDSLDDSGENDTRWWPQVKCGPYIVDFLFEVSYGGKIRTVIVECDGHDFHERTKEQARKDRARDRFFILRGWTVLRFTGSEIVADPARCIEELSAILSRHSRELIEGDQFLS
jgi:very-short-patch-repair endonuclease